MATRIPKRRPPPAAARLESRKRPSQRRSRLTVDQLLEAAARVFEEHGFASGTTNRIAARAGVSVGSLYQYFPNKEAVAVALLERHIADAARRLDAWIATLVAEPRPLGETLRFFVEQALALHADRPRLHHVLFEETRLPPRLHDALHAWETRAAQRLAGLMRAYREVRHPNVQVAAAIALETVEALAHRFAAHPRAALPPAALARELTAMLEGYLTGGTSQRGLGDGEPPAPAGLTAACSAPRRRAPPS
ncbi:MAG: TetR/AcrR family transcriptional regulator [Myxococcales bacterium]|nr:TetR/AcrR family transcriptional regulator [Myxococcales bacterium]